MFRYTRRKRSAEIVSLADFRVQRNEEVPYSLVRGTIRARDLIFQSQQSFEIAEENKSSIDENTRFASALNSIVLISQNNTIYKNAYFLIVNMEYLSEKIITLSEYISIFKWAGSAIRDLARRVELNLIEIDVNGLDGDFKTVPFFNSGVIVKWDEVDQAVIDGYTNLIRRSIDAIKNIINIVEAQTASDELNDEKFRAAADAKAVGEMFARAREGAGINKSEASRATGMATKDIRQFENGDHSPTLKKIERYAEALGLEARVELVPKDNS